MQDLSMLKKTQYKTKEFEHCFCQYLKNHIADIRFIPLDHVTNFNALSGSCHTEKVLH